VDSDTSFTYTNIYLDVFPFPLAIIDFAFLGARLNGVPIGLGRNVDPVISFLDVAWTQNGQARQTEAIYLYVDALMPDEIGLDIPIADRGVAEVLFVLARDPLETYSVVDLLAFLVGIDGFAVPTGTFAPNTAIPMAALGGTIAEDDLILGFDTGDDNISVGIGNDTIRGLGGDDTVYGGTGNDEIYGGNGNDTLFVGAGDDLVGGGDGADEIGGGSGMDSLWGGDGNDLLDGGTGNDTLRGVADQDTFVFTAGQDTVIDYGAGGTDDIVALGNAVGIADFTDLQRDHLVLVNGVATIADQAGNTMTLQDITSLAGFDQTDFTF